MRPVRPDEIFTHPWPLYHGGRGGSEGRLAHAAGAPYQTVHPLRPDCHLAAAVLPGQTPPALDCHGEYVAGGAARVGGSAAGEHRAACACIRPRRLPNNVCVYDSTWEASNAFVLANFEVLYVHRGVVRKYRPDFLVRLAAGVMLVLENRGHHTEQDHVKRRYLDEWT